MFKIFRNIFKNNYTDNILLEEIVIHTTELYEIIVQNN